MNTASKSLSLFVWAALVFWVAASAVPAAAATYQVDPAHAYILFRVKHLDIGYSYGRFDGPDGVIEWDAAAPEKSRIEISVQAINVDTDNEKRDQHLRSADFFHVDQHPDIAFESTAVKPTGDDTFEVAGNLTLLGKTRPVTVNVRQTGAGKDPWGKTRIGFETTFTIQRSDWGMNFMLNGVSDTVDVTVSVEGIRQ
jgi:polyisoprenoid-binding protein YceI